MSARSDVTFSILASDFHLGPHDPAGIDVFRGFARDVVAGARRFYVLGDLFEVWIGPKHLREPAHREVFTVLSDLARGGTEVVLFHGNRDFLLGGPEAAAARGRVVGEECTADLHGHRALLLHGDSLCTDDVGYQASKRWLRSRLVRGLARALPRAVLAVAARRIRGKSMESVARKPAEMTEIVPGAVRARFAEGHELMVCGHVHHPGRRTFETPAGARDLFVLGAWHGSGVFARADAAGVRLERYAASRTVEPFAAAVRVGADVDRAFVPAS